MMHNKFVFTMGPPSHMEKKCMAPYVMCVEVLPQVLYTRMHKAYGQGTNKAWDEAEWFISIMAAGVVC